MKTEGFSKGDEIHEMMVDLVQIYFETIVFKNEKIELISDYQDGKYIYDLYVPKYDIPIEIGANKESKLNDLLEMKKMICLVLLERRIMCSLDWLMTKKIMVHNYKSLNIILVTKYNIPGFKYMTERISYKRRRIF